MIFKDFFCQATGYAPFPYQEALAEADLSRLALAAPTGAGKTAAAFMAWLWQRQQLTQDTPTRLVLCEPQRTLVEQVFQEVTRWLHNLGLDEAVKVHAMQGGYLDQSWELSPEQPAVIIGTQDQLLSRALNRGYAMSRFRWPIHFGLLNNDVQWVFDELQLMGPGLETSAQLHGLRQKIGVFGQARTLWMSATLDPHWLNTVDHLVSAEAPLPIHPFTEADKAVENMAARLHASKPLTKLELEPDSKGEALAQEVIRLHQPGSFTLVILNTVKRARQVYQHLLKKHSGELHLLHSRFRPQDRAKVLSAVLAEGVERIVVSTQVVEAGVDLSADVLITELAPISSMIQRFGRCNRKGDKPNAQAYWVDLPEKAAAPYAWSDLQASAKLFEALESVEPARFEDQKPEARPLFDTLRRRDLLDLFDTAGDLTGLDIDVSRFIRDGDSRDVFLFWRSWPGDIPPLDLPAPSSGELCKVAKDEVRKLLAKVKPDTKNILKLWSLDDLNGTKLEWRRVFAGDLVSGRTYLVPAQCGCYTAKAGWLPESKDAVEDLGLEGTLSPFPSLSGDPRSEFQSYLTLWQHTHNVCQELNLILPGLQHLFSEQLLIILKQAALWHDVGKAHPVFQETMKKGEFPANLNDEELWAKRVGSAFHSRRYFRHELASALAARAYGLDPLTQYLIASHHGKARLSIRALPEEADGFILGIREGDTLPAIDFPGEGEVIAGLQLPNTQLSLKALELGRGSWQDQALALRDQELLGAFRLAYLEALLRAADVRASILEKKGPLIHA